MIGASLLDFKQARAAAAAIFALALIGAVLALTIGVDVNGAHRWLESILLADRNALRGENSYTDEYYDRFYNEAGAILIRQLSDAATDIGSFWLTAWANAGGPALPH